MPGKKSERNGCLSLFSSYLLAFVVFVIGFSSPYWIWDQSEPVESYAGLWKACAVPQNQDRVCESVDFSRQDDWYIAVVSFMIVALILATFGGGVTAWNPLSASLQMAAGAFGLAGTIWYAVEMEENISNLPNGKLHWAFWLSFCGSILLLLNGIGLLILSITQRCSMRQQLPCGSSEVDVI